MNYEERTKEEVELQELDIKGAVTGALNKGSQFMKKNPVGRAVGNVLKPVGLVVHCSSFCPNSEHDPPKPTESNEFP